MNFNKKYKFLFNCLPLLSCYFVNKNELFLKYDFYLSQILLYFSLVFLAWVLTKFIKQVIIKKNDLQTLNIKYQSDLILANSEILASQSEIDFLNEEIDKNNIMLTCCICKSQQSTHTLIPCGHFCLCHFCLNCLTCYQRLNKEALTCPRCRRRVRNAYRTYFN
jgi:hypothetical protein